MFTRFPNYLIFLLCLHDYQFVIFYYITCTRLDRVTRHVYFFFTSQVLWYQIAFYSAAFQIWQPLPQFIVITLYRLNGAEPADVFFFFSALRSNIWTLRLGRGFCWNSCCSSLWLLFFLSLSRSRFRLLKPVSFCIQIRFTEETITDQFNDFPFRFFFFLLCKQIFQNIRFSLLKTNQYSYRIKNKIISVI